MKTLYRGKIFTFNQSANLQNLQGVIPDALFVNDERFTFLRDGAIIVENGKISAVGDYNEINSLLSSEDKTIDYRGKLIAPGFIDTHIHYPQTEMVGAYGEQLLSWLNTYLSGIEAPQDVLRTLLELTAVSLSTEIAVFAPKAVYVCGGGIRNQALMVRLSALLVPQQADLKSSADLQLDPQWVEAAAFGWLAACWVEGINSNPVRATGARHPCVLGAGYYA